jgi:hypothetical protein
MVTDGKIVTELDDEYLTIWCYPAQGLLHHRWKKFCTGEPFRQYLLRSAEAFEKHNCFKWLSDDREFNGAVATEDWKWGQVHFAQRCVDAGWKYHALVLPEKALAKTSIRALTIYFTQMGIEIQVFADPSPAQKWIAGKLRPPLR